MRVTYNNEYSRRLRWAAIGCGGHAVRNVFPTHQYAPIDLVGVCDLDLAKAQWCARMFGGQRAYTDYRQMLEREQPEAVQVVVGYDRAGLPLYPDIAIECMKAGAHVWIEKPPAARAVDIARMMEASRQTGKFVGVGFKKMFFPANVKAKEILSRPEFGAISTVTARYPQSLPPLEKRQDPKAMLGFLDHMVHPWSVLKYLAGPAESIFVQRAENGGSVTAIRFENGAVGALHLPNGTGSGSFMERTEIVGSGGNIVIDNNTRLQFYRHGTGPDGGYGRAGSFYGADESAALVWEPEFSLGQLYNKGIFLLGYAPEMLYFCQCALENTPPQVGNLEDAMHLLLVYEAYCKGDEQLLRIPKACSCRCETAAAR